jgi:two-component system, chemotaxis family, chemotaxis protein CheY
MGKKKVLIVDDSQTVRQQVGVVLAHAGFEVLEAVDGEAGAATVAARDDIAAIVCDVNMPRLNGIDMLVRIKSMPNSTAIPVLMLTTERQPALIKKAKDAGAKGWMVKPFKASQLVAAVQKLTG